jgi:hypothetical protein
MKKYSWIFALILALTMAFVFAACGGDDDEDTKDGENGDGTTGGTSDAAVSNLTIGGLLPVKGAAAVTTVSGDTQYSGTVAWKATTGGAALSGNFAPATAYTATITLTAKSGFTFAGVAANAFAVTGSATKSNPAGSGKTLVVTATFPATEADVAGEPQFFIDAVGLKTGIEGQNKATFDSETGIIDCTDVSGSKLIVVDVPATSATGTKMIIVNYACYLVSGEAKITLKNGAWGDPENCTGSGGTVNFEGLSIYQTLSTTAIGTLLLPEAMYANGKEKISFQVNGDTNAYKLKLISVTMTEVTKALEITFSQSWSGLDLMNSFFDFQENDNIEANGKIITVAGATPEFIFNDKPGAWGVVLYQKTGAVTGTEWDFNKPLTSQMITNIKAANPSGIRIQGNNVTADTLVAVIGQIKITRGEEVILDLVEHLDAFDFGDDDADLIIPESMGFQKAGDITVKVVAVPVKEE